jgi:ubiquitin C-terminal hydrolase
MPEEMSFSMGELAWSSFGNTLRKITNYISYPIDDLILDNYIEGYDKFGCSLKLISIGCHKGTLNCGHYFAICRHSNNNWYKYDDDTVSQIDIYNNESIFKDGYILIYEKND